MKEFIGFFLGAFIAGLFILIIGPSPSDIGFVVSIIAIGLITGLVASCCKESDTNVEHRRNSDY